MKKIAKILTALALLFSVCACGNDPIDKKIKDPIDRKINEAAECINDDNHEKALRISDNLLNNDFSQMSLEQKCDLAVLYCLVYDELLDDEIGYKFVAVFDETMKNPQAARKYYKNVYGDDVYEMLSLAKQMVELGQEIDSW